MSEGDGRNLVVIRFKEDIKRFLLEFGHQLTKQFAIVRNY